MGHIWSVVQPTLSSLCPVAHPLPTVFLQAETRAEFAERSVAKLEKTIDDLEGKMSLPVLRPSFLGSTGHSMTLVDPVIVWPG